MVGKGGSKEPFLEEIDFKKISRQETATENDLLTPKKKCDKKKKK